MNQLLRTIISVPRNIAPAFVSGGTGWTVLNPDGTHIVTFGDGSARFQSDTTSPVLTLRASILTSGRRFRITFPVIQHSSGQVQFDIVGATVIVPSGVGLFTTTFVASSALLSIYRATANVDLTLGDIIVRQVG